MLDRLGEHLRDGILPRLDATLSAVEKVLYAERRLIVSSVTTSVAAAADSARAWALGLAFLVAAVQFLCFAIALAIAVRFEPDKAVLCFLALGLLCIGLTVFCVASAGRKFRKIQSCLAAIDHQGEGEKEWNQQESTAQAKNA